MSVFVVYFFVVLLLLCSMVFFTASYSNVICVITAACLGLDMAHVSTVP